MKVAVVIRHLPGCEPACSAVLKESEFASYDNIDKHLQCKAEEHIKYFKQQFVEFNAAKFTITIMDAY